MCPLLTTKEPLSVPLTRSEPIYEIRSERSPKYVPKKEHNMLRYVLSGTLHIISSTEILEGFKDSEVHEKASSISDASLPSFYSKSIYKLYWSFLNFGFIHDMFTAPDSILLFERTSISSIIESTLNYNGTIHLITNARSGARFLVFVLFWQSVLLMFDFSLTEGRKKENMDKNFKKNKIVRMLERFQGSYIFFDLFWAIRFLRYQS